MSTVAPVPSRSADRLAEARGWLSPLNLHVIGVGLLVLFNLYLLVHLLVVWSARSKHTDEAMLEARARISVAEMAARPLRGVDQKIMLSDQGAQRFYQERLPFAYSNVLVELGALAKRENVKLSRGQYLQTPALDGLTELRMDATMSGEYEPLVRFINGLERDHVFFLVRGLGLTGQQSGVVNLRLGLTTYLREPMPAPGASAVVPAAVEGGQR